MDYLPGKNEQNIDLSVDNGKISGILNIFDKAKGLVIFAHGSGSSRHSPRNALVAKFLNEKGLSTLLFDLLTTAEETEDELTALYRFDIKLLTKRLILVTEWILERYKLKIGYFGSSTGAAAALTAAGTLKEKVSAVVSRGGRGDLASSLEDVSCPTLLIVGGNDTAVLELNRKVYKTLNCTKSLQIVAGASHLFEEPHKLDEVASLAAKWFLKHF